MNEYKIVDKQVCKMVKTFFFFFFFFCNGHLLKDINMTLITLIPKFDNPESTNHFRPISCCNVFMEYSN